MPTRKLRLCFHPLKSGRNFAAKVVALLPDPVFPSPQVGSEPTRRTTGCCCLREFPSPQVGSEHRYIALLHIADEGFHPLKSGRNLHFCKTAKRCCPVSIPSSRVGTECVCRDAVTEHLSFHPLKSGRNSERASEQISIHQVSIPSSRVGTIR